MKRKSCKVKNSRRKMKNDYKGLKVEPWRLIQEDSEVVDWP
jgi:hypothetical protein